MQLTAEIRWFWPAAPDGLVDWFLSTTIHTGSAHSNTRIDLYLDDGSQSELGLKHRAGQPGVEIKGRIAVLPQPLAAGPLAGPIELWGKWFSAPLALHTLAIVTVEKRRWLRRFIPSEATVQALPQSPLGSPRPARGCTVELTQVTLADGTVWWTLGCTAFGTLATVATDLHKVGDWLAARRPPPLGTTWAGGYPAWLAHIKHT